MSEIDNMERRVCTTCGGEYWVEEKETILYNAEKDDMSEEDFENNNYVSKPLIREEGCPYCGEEGFDDKDIIDAFNDAIDGGDE